MWNLAKRKKAPTVILLAHSIDLGLRQGSAFLQLSTVMLHGMLVAENSGKELESSLDLLCVHFIREATFGQW